MERSPKERRNEARAEAIAKERDTALGLQEICFKESASKDYPGMYSDCSWSSSSSPSDDDRQRRRRDRRRQTTRRRRREIPLYEESYGRGRIGGGDHHRDPENISLQLLGSKVLSPLVLGRDSDKIKSPSAARLLERLVDDAELRNKKQRHAKELRNLVQFLDQELKAAKPEKRDQLKILQKQHDHEVNDLLEFLETELYECNERHAKRRSLLEDKLEKFETFFNKETARYSEETRRLQGELRAAKERAAHYERSLRDEGNASERLQKEVQLLRGQLAEKENRIVELENRVLQQESKAPATHPHETRWRSRDRDRPPIHQDSLWDEASGLTETSDFEEVGSKQQRNYERTTSMGGSRAARQRCQRESRELSVSFSDELVVNRSASTGTLPMAAHDSLTRKLERMYLNDR